MRKYNKVIILSSILVVLIAFVTLAMVFDFDLLLFNNLSIVGVENKKQEVDDLKKYKDAESDKYTTSLNDLKQAKDNFDVEKQAYENIPSSDIAIVQQATIDEKYFIEYLWVVLGNYAKVNNLNIDIITPGAYYSYVTNKDENTNDTDKNTQETTKKAEETKNSNDKNESVNREKIISEDDNTIKIIINGRYSDLADFVFDVENDSSLKFKLDNIKMTYSGDNKVTATFDVLSLSVLN